MSWTRGAIAVGVLLAGAACDNLIDPWRGWVYPNKHDLTDDIALGKFRTLEQCRASAREVMQRTQGEGEGDYECGYQCKHDGTLGGLYICRQTVR